MPKYVIEIKMWSEFATIRSIFGALENLDTF